MKRQGNGPKKKGIRWIDLDGSFKAEAKVHRPFFEQDVHPNEYGHSAIFEAIAKEYPELFFVQSERGK